MFGVFLLALVAGCASVPFDYPKSESHAVAPGDSTRLGRMVAEWNGGDGAAGSSDAVAFDSSQLLSAG